MLCIEIAKKAIERKTGARGLRSIIEGIMLDVMYELPSRDDIAKCIITKETVLKILHQNSFLKMERLKKKKEKHLLNIIRKPSCDSDRFFSVVMTSDLGLT